MEQLSERLLANPVIEDARFQLSLQLGRNPGAAEHSISANRRLGLAGCGSGARPGTGRAGPQPGCPPLVSWLRDARVGVVVFPGTNCEHDVVEAFESLGVIAELVWHGYDIVGGLDAVVLPGGFAHGDYLRPGAIARFSPVMDARDAVRSRRRPGGRDMQRLSGTHGGAPAAGGTPEEPWPYLPVPDDRARGGQRPVGAHGRRGGGAPAPGTHKPFRRQLHRGTGHVALARGRGPRGPALRHQPQWIGPRHCRDMQRGLATWSASCPIPSGPAACSSARQTAWCCCGRCWRGRAVRCRAVR